MIDNNNKKEKYETIRTEFEKRNCKLISTYEDYLTMKKLPKFEYIASCNHYNKVFYHAFLYANSGIKCPKCAWSYNSEIIKKNNKLNENGQSVLTEMEDKSIEYISYILSDNFTIKKTVDGCLADIAIQPNNIVSDKWLMVQVKTTSKPNKTYNFKCNSSYKDCLIFCICNQDNKMWLLNGNDIKTKNKIAIGLKKSKYDIFEINLENIKDNIIKYYNNIPCYPFENINIPICKNAKYENEFKLYRENKIKCLTFAYPDKQSIVYDFMINNKKIQEKIGHKKNNFVYFLIRKSNGYINKIKKFQKYCEGDNDFYWLNSPDKKTFWFIPEKVLIEHKYISNKLENNKVKLLSVNKNQWLDNFKFDYDIFNLNKFNIILNDTLPEIENCI